MNIELVPLTIDAYDRVVALWNQCEGVGLSRADSKTTVAFWKRMGWTLRNDVCMIAKDIIYES